MPTAAVIYAAKSTTDEHGSIPTQLADARGLAESDGFSVVGEFRDEAASAYKGNRGPNLARATAEAERLAGERGGCALVVQHSDRLARGDGEQAQHLVEIVLWARRAGVTLRSVQDPQTFEGLGLVYAAMMGDRNHEDSARKSKATRAGKRRRAERGQLLGGPIPDGYVRTSRFDDRGEPVGRYELDPERAPTIRRIFDLAAAGMTPTAIARRLNGEGSRTRRHVTQTGANAGREWGGKPWTGRRVRATLACRVYAGMVTHGGDVFEGQHPSLVDAATFERIQRSLAARNPAPDRPHVPRRAATRHLLAGLATCSRCGERMYAVTAGWKRADGSQARHYVCPNVKGATGTCDAPRVNAEIVEPFFVRHLHHFVTDLDAWVAARQREQTADRADLEAAIARDRTELVRLDGLAARVRGDYLRRVEAGESDAAIVAAEALKDVDARRSQAQYRLEAQEAALTALPDERSVDAILDLYNELSAAIRGHAAGATPREVNERLREVFDWVEFDPALDGAGRRPQLQDGSVRIRAYVSEAFLAARVDPDAWAVVEAVADRADPSLGDTGRLTFVKVHPVFSQISL